MRTAPVIDTTTPTGFWRRPLVWIWFAPVLLLVEGLFLGPATDAPWGVAAPFMIASGLAALGVYRVVMRRIVHRPMPELARTHAVSETLKGAGVGAGFILASIGLVTLFGGFSFSHGAGDVVSAIVTAVVGAAAGALTEELAFRGIALQAIEKVGGTWWAIAITALVFGFAHGLNPDASLWSSISIAIEAGVLLGAAFAWRRNLWFAVGLHAAWNAIEELLGVPVSGHRDPSLTRITAHGSSFISGGSFGVEASIVPVLLSLLIALPMLVLAHRNGNLFSRKAIVAARRTPARTVTGSGAGLQGLDRLDAPELFAAEKVPARQR